MCLLGADDDDEEEDFGSGGNKRKRNFKTKKSSGSGNRYDDHFDFLRSFMVVYKGVAGIFPWWGVSFFFHVFIEPTKYLTQQKTFFIQAFFK